MEINVEDLGAATIQVVVEVTKEIEITPTPETDISVSFSSASISVGGGNDAAIEVPAQDNVGVQVDQPVQEFGVVLVPTLEIKVGGEDGVYTTDDIAEASNLYFTEERARNSISADGDLSYDPSTGIISYTMPAISIGDIVGFTDNSAQWDEAFSWGNHALAGYLTSETYSSPAQLLAALLTVDGSTSNLDADLLDGEEGSYYLSWTNFTDLPASFAPDDHVLSFHSDVTITDITDGELLGWTGLSWENRTLAELNISEVGHTHLKANITDFSDADYATAAQGSLADSALQSGDLISALINDVGYITGISWVDVTDKPLTFAPSAHTHLIADITDFTDNSVNWDTAFGWGDHAAENYLKDAFKFIKDDAGITRLTASGESDITFEGTGDVTISFDSVARKIIINSVPGAGGTGAVLSFNTRTGAVTPASNDYDTALVSENPSGGKYFTDARARAAVSASGDLSYNSTTGVFSFSETYSSAAELLSALLTVDGAASALDADLLDGQHGAYYLDWANLTGVPATFTPSAHTHIKADITDFSDGDYATAAQGLLADSAIQPLDNLSALTNDVGYITGVSWSDVTDKPLTFDPSDHMHLIADITDFTDNSVSWDAAYQESILSATFSGGENETLTLIRRNGKTLTAHTSKSLNDLTDVKILTLPSPISPAIATLDDNGYSYNFDCLGEELLDIYSNTQDSQFMRGSILGWDGTQWINRTAADLGLSKVGHTHVISDITDFTDNSANWDTAFSWGDHASAGYLTSETYSTANELLTALLTVDGAGSRLDADLLDGRNSDYYLAWVNLSGVPTTFTPSAHTHVKSDITDFSDADYATAAQGVLADSALQNGDNISSLTNNVGYLTSETNDLTANVVWATVPDAYISLSSIRQHQWSLLIDWSQLMSVPTTFTPSAHTHVKADITDFSDADYATAAQGVLADSALQSGDNISVLNNDVGYITGIGWADVTGKPSTFEPSAHALDFHSDVSITTVEDGDILSWNGLNWVNQNLAKLGIATAAQGLLADSALQAGDNISSLTNDSGYLTTVSWAQITGKPTTFTPSAHTHVIADVTDFVDNSTNWNTAFGWGDHAAANYAKKNANETISGEWQFNKAIQQESKAQSGTATVNADFDIDGSSNLETLTANAATTGTVTITLPDPGNFRGKMNIRLINMNSSGTALTINASGGANVYKYGTIQRTPESRDMIMAVSDGTDWDVVMFNNGAA